MATSTSTDSNLKRCPFCDGEAENEAVDILKAHKPEIEQLHAKLGAVETKERKQ
jgi:hypothetical protein